MKKTKKELLKLSYQKIKGGNGKLKITCFHCGHRWNSNLTDRDLLSKAVINKYLLNVKCPNCRKKRASRI